MYVHAHDPVRGLAVWYFRDATDEDWAQHFAHLDEIATWSRTTGKRAACVLVVGRFDVPDAKRRAELAWHTEQPGYDPYVAFIAPNAAVRGALTVMSWLQKKPRFESGFVSSPEEAQAWLEERRGEPLPALGRMIDGVLARAGHAAPRAPVMQRGGA
ncbi:hypothetical protein [Sandaracinus amylolyticus]|uniref:STAS/SEC14 domain-containing protein n=1 Tax=Sandaracinus amylolyticus TaxID=927083 RepID=A0A0F6YLE9_9BACT|nr:hypothetical protein [Sandaracinus amylolyticus]AKF08270.1 hypothetical protein DB32_005419 [Sandaracinus amylolyticus]